MKDAGKEINQLSFLTEIQRLVEDFFWFWDTPDKTHPKNSSTGEKKDEQDIWTKENLIDLSRTDN